MADDELSFWINKHNTELSQKLERIDKLNEDFSGLIDMTQTIVNSLPDSNRKEYLDLFQFLLSIIHRQNSFIKDNFRLNYVNTMSLDYLAIETNKNNIISDNKERIMKAVESYQTNEPIVKHIRRKLEDEARDLEGKEP